MISNVRIDFMPREGQARQVLFLSSTRADFGKLKPLIAEVARTPGFEYSIFATGTHMLARYGSTVIEIQKAGFDRIFPFVNHDGDGSGRMETVLANTVLGLGSYVREFRPDLIVVHGDRIEALAGAIVGSMNNILVAHVEGGEVSGTIDGLLRHACSKLCHVHFVANDVARQRVLQMGEHPESVFVIGSPDIDVMVSDRLPPIEKVLATYEIPFDDYFICLYHPVTTEAERTAHDAAEVVTALEESGRNFVVLYPNSDAGAALIFHELERLRGNAKVRMLPSMSFESFLVLLKHARAIVGNSSAGIREAPVYGVPTVNIGTRQMNRFRHTSIVDVPPQRDAILHAIEHLPRRSEPSHHFGRGDSAGKFIAVLQRPEIWNISPQKQFYDVTFDAPVRNGS